MPASLPPSTQSFLIVCERDPNYTEVRTDQGKVSTAGALTGGPGALQDPRTYLITAYLIPRPPSCSPGELSASVTSLLLMQPAVAHLICRALNTEF